MFPLHVFCFYLKLMLNPVPLDNIPITELVLLAQLDQPLVLLPMYSNHVLLDILLPKFLLTQLDVANVINHLLRLVPVELLH